jgi:hypothetical protein
VQASEACLAKMTDTVVLGLDSVCLDRSVLERCVDVSEETVGVPKRGQRFRGHDVHSYIIEQGVNFEPPIGEPACDWLETRPRVCGT